MSIIDWEYYSSLHCKVKDVDFDKYEALAEKEVRSVVGVIRWNEITEETFGYNVLKDCICDVMDKMLADEESGRGKGVKSVSNDGYSETYAIADEADLRNDMKAFIRAELSGTGLVRAF